jgi:hypothetical protein
MEDINIWFLLAGSAGIFTGIIHCYMGETRLISPVLAHPVGVLKGVVRQRILRNAFYLPGIYWAIMGVMIIAMAFSKNPPLLPLYFALSIYMSGLFANLQATRGWHIGWFLLLLDSGLLLTGILQG